LRIGFAPETIAVVHNGINLERFAIKDDRARTRQALGLPPEAFVAIYAGRIDRAKNIEMLLHAFAQLRLTAEQARLLVVGSPVLHATPEEGESYVQELKNLCDKLAIGSSVHWLGRRTDIPDLFRAADVSVLPSLLPECHPRALIESMACGTPALGLRYGGIPEVLSGEFERFQIEVSDVSGLANLLQSLNGWQQNDPTLGQRCRAYVEKRFPKERMVEGVERVLQQAVGLGAARLGPSPKTLQPWRPDALGI
jgi:glycosyltransferase involved in cell wall biosynthesis